MSQFSFEGGNRVRPLGITIIAVLLAISGLLGLCGGLASIGFAPFQLATLHVGHFFSGVIDGALFIILSLFELGLASALWNLRPWAFWATVIIEVINLIFGGIHLGFGLGSGLIALIVLIYLFVDGNVRRAFNV